MASTPALTIGDLLSNNCVDELWKVQVGDLLPPAISAIACTQFAQELEDPSLKV